MGDSVIIDPNNGPRYLHVGLKMGWAKHHLDLLNKQFREFVAEKPYSCTAQDDVEIGQHIMQFTLNPPPVEFSLIVGDFVSCLRGSLDHLATALARTTDGICNDRNSFPLIGVNNSEGRKSFKLAVKGIPGPAVEVIRSLQPYHEGEAYRSTKLWRLHRLWNIDKHRRIPFHGGVGRIKIGLPADMPCIPSGTDGSGIVRIPIAAKSKVKINPLTQVRMEFGDETEGIIVPYEELIEIYNFVAGEVVPRFKQFLEA